ncbi:MAG: hypothetical protein JXD19_05185 [Deltaproteobacteria bacterium]|nr:hypothetical protein [Deltaproteobacteria bacterium]
MSRITGISIICIVTAVLCFGCAGKTKVKFQQLPSALVETKEDVGIVVLGIGRTKHWSQMEIAIANMRSEPVRVDTRDIYLKNEKGYYLVPYSNAQIEEKIRKRTGQYVNPLSVGAVGTALAAIILPSKHDRDVALRTAAVLAGTAIAAEVADHQGADRDLETKDDFFLKHHTIPSGLKLGGFVYYPPVAKATGMKAIMSIGGQDVAFEIEF